jgi:hypothetical protein
VSPSPDQIISTLQAYRDAAALHTAIDLDLFTRIAYGTDTASKIASEINVPVRGIRLLCENLAVAGLLEKEDEQLKLTPESAAFLDRKSPRYLGAALDSLYSPALRRGYEQLTDTVRSGASPAPAKGRPDWFDSARGVHDPMVAGQVFAEAAGFVSGPLKLLEIGAGDLGIALARLNPEAIVVAADSAEALAVMQPKAEAAGLGTRYQNVPGDPLVAALGMEYDAAILAGAVYRFDNAQLTSLLMRVHYALKKGGRVTLLEFLSEDSPEFLQRYAGFRLNVLAATSRGDTPTLAEVRSVLEASGFHDVEARGLPAVAATIITAVP